MAFGAQKRLLLMLAVELHQRRADAPERLHRRDIAVEGDARAAAFRDDPAHGQLAPDLGSAAGNASGSGLAFNLEQRLDDRVFLARADHVGRTRARRAADPARQDDGLAGAGFSRQDIEPRAKLEGVLPG